MGSNDLILPGVLLLGLLALGRSAPGGVVAQYAVPTPGGVVAQYAVPTPGGVLLGGKGFFKREDEKEDDYDPPVKTVIKTEPAITTLAETVTEVIETVTESVAKVVEAKPGGVIGSYLSEGYFAKLDPGLGEATPYSKQAEGTLRFGLPEGEYR